MPNKNKKKTIADYLYSHFKNQIGSHFSFCAQTLDKETITAVH